MKEKTEYPTAPPNLKLVFKLLKKYSPTAQNATIKKNEVIDHTANFKPDGFTFSRNILSKEPTKPINRAR